MVRGRGLDSFGKSTVTSPVKQGYAWYARGDSNSRTRLRRPALYPLSYGRLQPHYMAGCLRPQS